MVELCKARPYEKESAHGFLPGRAFIALRFAEASSSLWPPERNIIPGKAGGTVRCKAVTVALAMASGEVVFHSALECPGVTMLGFKRAPSKRTLFS